MMSTYFTMGVSINLIWANFYYTALIGYVLCCLFIDKKQKEDIIIGTISAGGIWILYLCRPFISPIYYEWVRFCFGCVVGVMAFFYLIYVVTSEIKNIIKKHGT